MKKLIFSSIWFGCLFWAMVGIVLAQLPNPNVYKEFQYFGFEHRLEANGVVVAAGNTTDTTYHTSISLDGNIRHNGDSSVVAFVTKANGNSDCNIAADTCQRHRAYTVQRFYGHKVEVGSDSTKFTGVPLQSPIYSGFWYRYSNLVLGGTKWESPATWCSDKSDSCKSPVTLVRDSSGWIHFEHVPYEDSATVHTYIANLSNDPKRLKVVRPNEWALIQVVIDLDSLNGWAKCWVTNPRGYFLTAACNVRWRNGTLAQFHAGMYCSPSIAHGTIWNDDLIIAHVPDTNYAIGKYMNVLPWR